MDGWQKVFRVSWIVAAAMPVMAALFPWQTPPLQVEAIWTAALTGMAVSGTVLLRRWLVRRRGGRGERGWVVGDQPGGDPRPDQRRQ